MQGPREEDFNRISTKSSHKEFWTNWARCACQDPEENLTRLSKKNLLLLERALQDLGTSPPTRAFTQAPLRHDTCKAVMQGPLREDLTRISARSSVQGLYRIMQGPLREEVSRISARAGLHENLQWNCRRLKVSEPAPQTWTQSRQTWTHVARAILCENSEGKCRAPGSGQPFLCKPMQWKWTWTCQKSKFMQ